jgi:hypothetical protein
MRTQALQIYYPRSKRTHQPCTTARRPSTKQRFKTGTGLGSFGVLVWGLSGQVWVLGRCCYCIWGASYVSSVCWGLTFFVGSFGFLVVLGCFFYFLGVCWGLIFVYLGFWGFSLSFGFPLFLWANWVVHLYTSCVLKALYAFFNKIFLLIKKKTGRRIL